MNITNSATEIDDDAAWSPDGQKILWTFHNASDNLLNSPSKEVWVMNADGSGRMNLTNNGFEERAPTWSPDGTRAAYMCRTNAPRREPLPELRRDQDWALRTSSNK
jgi:TolB protein